MAATSTIVDNFNGTVFGPAWVDVYGGATLDTATGRGRVPTAHTAGTPDYAGIQTDTTWTLDDIYVRVYPQDTNGATVDCYTTLAFEDATVAGTRITITFDHVAGTLVFSSQVEYFEATATSVPFSATAHTWWRLTVSGGNLLFRTSSDGSAWTTHRTITAPTWVTGGTGSVLLDAYRASGTASDAYFDNVNVAGAARVSVALSLVGTSAWVSGTTAPAPSYPAGVQSGDLVQLIVHSKPSTVTPATPAGWTYVGTGVGGTGTQGSGTGQTRVTVFQRVVTSAVTGTQVVTHTGGNVALAHMRAWRAAAGYLVQYETLLSTWTVATASTAVGGTTTAMELAAGDELAVIVGTRDDESATLTVTSVTAAGATIGPLTRDPASTAVTATGNQMAATAYRASVTAGAAVGNVTVAATSSSSETAVGAVLRVRATAETVATTPTHLYLTSLSSSVNPLVSMSGWTNNAIAGTPNHLGTGPAGQAMSSALTETATTNPYLGLLRQFISLPAATSGFVSGDYQLVVGRMESDAAADMVLQLMVWVMNGATSDIRGVVYAGFGTVELPTAASAASMSGTVGFVEFQAGDRLVVEVGYRATNAAATAYTGTMYFGGAGADLASGGTDMAAPAWINVPTTAGAFAAGLVTATATAPLGGLAGTAAGAPVVVGSGTAALGALTATATGVVVPEVVTATAAAALGALTATATGVKTVTGAAAAGLGVLTATAVGTVQAEIVTGAATAPLGTLTATATGASSTPGVVDASALLGPLTATAVGVKMVYGTASAGDPNPEDFPSDTGFPSDTLFPGDGRGTLGFTATATGTSGESGSAAADLGGLTAQAVGTRHVAGVAAAALGAVTVTATGVRTVFGEAHGGVPVGGLYPSEDLYPSENLYPAAQTWQLAAFTATASGTLLTSGAATASFGFAAAATGVRTVSGVGVADLGGLAAVATGVALPNPGTAVADLGGLAAEASGVRLVVGAADAVLGGLTATAIVPGAAAGTAEALLGGLAAVAVGLVNGQGPLALPLHAGEPTTPPRLRAGEAVVVVPVRAGIPAHVHALVS